MKQVFTLLLTLLLVGALHAQNHNHRGEEYVRCYTTEAEAERRAKNPKMPSKAEFEEWIQAESKKLGNTTNRRATVLTIPIIFHIIHNGEAVGTAPNIDATYVNAQIEQLNNDYRRILGTSGHNTNPVGADIEIEFCAATLDESGNTLAEPGINRINWTAQSDPYTSTYFDNTIKCATQWDPNLYLNFWSADLSGGLLGWAQFPEAATLDGIGTGNGSACTDGVVHLYSTIGSTTTPYPGGAPYNEGRTATHEIGHWLGLRHIWGDGACGTDDFCADTPESDASNGGCPTGHVSCGTVDMIENYMDYTNDACMNIFTQDQKTRMRIVMGDTGNGSVRRAILASSDRCGAPTPSVNFASSATSNQPEGTSCGSRTLSFDLTMTQAPSATTNVNIATSGSATLGDDYTISTSSVSFTTSNWDTPKTVTLTIIEDAVVEGDETLVLDMTVSGSDAVEGGSNQLSYTISDDDFNPTSTGGTVTVLNATFDTGADGFSTSNPNNATAWALGNVAAASSTYWNVGGSNTTQFAFTNDDDCNCNLSESYLISPSLDLTGASAATVTFDHAFSDVSTESAEIQISTDGGTSYTTLQTITNTSTDSGGGSYTTPWVTGVSVDLSAYVGITNAVLRWRYNDGGGWLYGMALDNVVVTKTSLASTIQTGTNNSAGFAEHNLGPNQTVHFYDQVSGNIMVTIENMTSHDYGCTRVEVDRTSDGTTGSFGSPNADREDIADKTFLVTPQFNNASGSYKITLYYTQEEINRWVSSNTNAEGLADLEMIKNSGSIAAAPSYEVALDAQGNFGTDYTFTATWNTGFSGFGLGDPAPPFPVEFINFDATPNRSTIDLAWATASERNNKGFEIQRSINARSGFETIGWVDGFGNTSDRQDYTFEDSAVRKGITYYYQLRQIDFDGSFEYSDIVSAQIVGKGIGVNMLPNPAKNAVAIILSGNLSDDLTLTIMDIQGRIVETQAVAKDATRIDLDITAYSAGVYFVKINSATETVVSKLIVE